MTIINGQQAMHLTVQELKKLPVSERYSDKRSITFKDRKKLKNKRRTLEQEIAHVKRLVAIAAEALDKLN
jgi:hypothetical protein